jgi:hypothetical protein
MNDITNSAQGGVDLARQLEQYCAQAEGFLADERQRIERVERDLVQQLAIIAAEYSVAEENSLNNQRSLESAASDRDALAKRNKDLEQAIELLEAAVSEHGGADTSELQQQADDLTRRNELARDEIRELKSELAEAKEQLANAAFVSANQQAPPTAGAGFDWESQKQRLIAALDAGGPAQPDEQGRVTIESTIEKTDVAIAAKDREIESLRHQLQQGSGTDAAEQADEVLDADEVIQQEREKLLLIQEEMREKQRKAEVDISLERAKLARERAALEEQLATADAEACTNTDKTESDEPEKKIGNWRTQLGLSD